MKNHLIYDELFKLSGKLFKQAKSTADNLEICVSHQKDIEEAIVSDLKGRLKEDFKVSEIQFILNDASYQQGSSGIKLVLKSVAGDIELAIECLIEHNRVWVKAVKGPRKIDRVISNKYNNEGHVELKDIRKIWS